MHLEIVLTVIKTLYNNADKNIIGFQSIIATNEPFHLLMGSLTGTTLTKFNISLLIILYCCSLMVKNCNAIPIENQI